MSDLHEWLKERRAIHDAAPRGVWEMSSAERDAFYNLPALLTAVANVLDIARELDGSADTFDPVVAQERRQAASMIRRAIEGEIKDA
ncbi:hypothetical protein [Brevibacterium picturae]|uniref:Uncharacterized protein n=1 Tax=Brevibacterium picturae TaxID=260553 RepID=A0ABN2BQ14_9MICO